MTVRWTRLAVGVHRFPVLRAALFFAYAALLLVLTHWPRLSINVDGVERPDLAIHMVAFGLWTLLLVLSGIAGDPREHRTSFRACIAAIVWSGLDEWSQSLPFIQRQAGWDDAMANWSGVLIATAATIVVRWFAGLRKNRPACLTPDERDEGGSSS